MAPTAGSARRAPVAQGCSTCFFCMRKSWAKRSQTVGATWQRTFTSAAVRLVFDVIDCRDSERCSPSPANPAATFYALFPRNQCPDLHQALSIQAGGPERCWRPELPSWEKRNPRATSPMPHRGLFTGCGFYIAMAYVKPHLSNRMPCVWGIDKSDCEESRHSVCLYGAGCTGAAKTTGCSRTPKKMRAREDERPSASKPPQQPTANPQKRKPREPAAPLKRLL